jgi:hypothetical protein
MADVLATDQIVPGEPQEIPANQYFMETVGIEPTSAIA